MPPSSLRVFIRVSQYQAKMREVQCHKGKDNALCGVQGPALGNGAERCCWLVALVLLVLPLTGGCSSSSGLWRCSSCFQHRDLSTMHSVGLRFPQALAELTAPLPSPSRVSQKAACLLD